MSFVKRKFADDRVRCLTMVLVVGLLIFLRSMLSNRLPAYIISESPHDDGWVVQRSYYMLKGQWMGPYNQYTLIKGVFSPLLLAFSIGIGMTFQCLNTALYCFACLVFVIAIRPVIKRRWLLVACFALLLFNPISYALQTGQRVYRNGMSQWQLLLIFGCLIALFLRRNNNWKSLLKWAILGGAALGAFLQTREDGVWIYPFVLVAAIVTIVAYLLEKKHSKGQAVPEKKHFRGQTILFLLPLVLALLTSGTVAAINYAYYGAPVVNDRDGGNYAKVMQDLYLITPDAQEDALYQSEDYQALYYNIYASTVEKAFAASPTLQSAAQPIRDAITMWDSWEDLKDGEPYADHILFAIRDGVQAAGYYKSLPDTEAFYGQIHHELQAAFKNGTLEKRGVSVSAMVAPLQRGDLAKTLSLMPGAIRTVIGFEGVSSESVPASGSPKSIETFRLLAGGDYYTASVGTLTGSGWAFAVDNGTQLTAGLYDATGTKIADVPFISGKDVYDYMIAQGFDYQNARTCRFSFSIQGYDLTSGVTLHLMDSNGKLFRELPMDGSATGGSDDGFSYAIDSLKTDSIQNLATDFYSRFVQRANVVTGVYQKISPFLSVLAFLAYIGTTVLLIRDFRKKRMSENLPVWLLLTGLVLSLVLFLLCLCFMTATTFNTLFYLYLAPAYALHLMFCGVAIFWGLDVLLDLRKHRAHPLPKEDSGI